MEAEKGKTYKYLKDKREVSQEAKENLKKFNTIKRTIIGALKEKELTVPQLAEKTNLPRSEVVFYLMSMVKFGFIQTGAVDDMDEYFYYKVKEK